MGHMRKGSNSGVKEAWQVASEVRICTSGSEPIVEFANLFFEDWLAQWCSH